MTDWNKLRALPETEKVDKIIQWFKSPRSSREVWRLICKLVDEDMKEAEILNQMAHTKWMKPGWDWSREAIVNLFDRYKEAAKGWKI